MWALFDSHLIHQCATANFCSAWLSRLHQGFKTYHVERAHRGSDTRLGSRCIRDGTGKFNAPPLSPIRATGGRYAPASFNEVPHSETGDHSHTFTSTSRDGASIPQSLSAADSDDLLAEFLQQVILVAEEELSDGVSVLESGSTTREVVGSIGDRSRTSLAREGRETDTPSSRTPDSENLITEVYRLYSSRDWLLLPNSSFLSLPPWMFPRCCRYTVSYFMFFDHFTVSLFITESIYIYLFFRHNSLYFPIIRRSFCCGVSTIFDWSGHW